LRRFVFVCLFGATLCGPTACREKQSDKTPSHSDIIGPPLLDKTAEQLTQTEFTAYLDHPVTPGKNLIWCATMPLVWNELMDLAGGEIHLAEGDPPIVTELNKKTVTRSDLDDSSYVALAGLTPGILDSIPKALQLKFKGQASPELLSQIPQDLPENSAVSYSYLFKNLEFEHRFEKLEYGSRFGSIKVNGFGFRAGRSKQPLLQDAAAQVSVHDYKNNDDFIVEIATRSMGDRLVLAKVHPGSTLVQTIAIVRERVARPPGTVPEDEVPMEIPILDFRLIKDYEELIGKHIHCPNPSLDGYPIEMVKQLIRFKLNEEGAKLKSEAVVDVTSAERIGVPPPQLIFDKPFLILMERKGAANPYFALWVDNPELLVPFTPEKAKQ